MFDVIADDTVDLSGVAVRSTSPVKTECLDDALASGLRFGVFGGLSLDERRKLGSKRAVARR